MTTILKVLELLGDMNPERRKAVGDAIRGRVRHAVSQEIIDRLYEAVSQASDAGVTDEEIIDFVQGTLRKRALARHVALALKYREASESMGSKGRTS